MDLRELNGVVEALRARGCKALPMTAPEMRKRAHEDPNSAEPVRAPLAPGGAHS